MIYNITLLLLKYNGDDFTEKSIENDFPLKTH